MFSSNATQVSAVTQAEAVDFDGTNDYLRRTSDLTGNTTSKTFTFSAWFWQGNANTSYFYVVSDGTNQRFVVRVVGNGTISVEGTANTNSVILSVTAPLANASRLNTFYHVLISMDMANAANRSIYINDVAQTLTVTTYTNTAIPFNQVDHVIAGTQGGSAGDQGRLSNVFLDYTYRDMSVTANRRLFVTADLKPAAGQAALNPILYLAMSDPTTVGTNTGTGGNFTLTGTVARSGRGPNQYNAPYSALDGGADYLLREIATSSSTAATLVFTTRLGGFGGSPVNVYNASFTTTIFVTRFSSSKLEIQAYSGTASPTLLMSYLSNETFVIGRNYVIAISFNLTSSATRHVYINGVSDSGTWSTYTNGSIAFGESGRRTSIGNDPINYGFYTGKIGAVWFSPGFYIDLSVASNRAKFVSGTGIDAKPVDLGATGELPTGTSPVVYLPMYGNNAGKNYGTGGDFTVTSGPYTGDRGPNEFWGNKATFNGTTGRLTKSAALTGVSAGKIFSASYFVTFAASATNQSMMHISNSGSSRLSIFRNTSNQLTLSGRNTSNTEILAATVTSPTIAAGSYSIQIVVDLANSANRAIYINGTAATVTWSTYTNGDIALASNAVNLGVADTGSYIYYLNGSLSEFYFTTEYIDFTQEANRLKFRDCFGNPTDLPSAITAASVPTPAIYMRFPPTSFGTNSGTGGDFTVSGTITDGGQL